MESAAGRSTNSEDCTSADGERSSRQSHRGALAPPFEKGVASLLLRLFLQLFRPPLQISGELPVRLEKRRWRVPWLAGIAPGRSGGLPFRGVLRQPSARARPVGEVLRLFDENSAASVYTPGILARLILAHPALFRRFVGVPGRHSCAEFGPFDDSKGFDRTFLRDFLADHAEPGEMGHPE
jgi:hypothetical protein